MAYNSEFSCAFADTEGRTHTVYLYQDGGTTTPNPVSLTPADRPFFYTFGSQGDDEYKHLKPTSCELNVYVRDSTLFDAIAGSSDFEWIMRWEVGTAEVWRGYVIPDEIEQPYDWDGIVTIRATCGLTLAQDIYWTPAATSDSIKDHLVDLFSDIGTDTSIDGHAYDISTFVNWYAYDSTTPVTGDPLAQYDIDSRGAAEKDPDSSSRRQRDLELSYPSVATVLGNLAGRFNAFICMANGDWNFVQREKQTGASLGGYRYLSDGTYDSTINYADYDMATRPDGELYGGIRKTTVPYGELTVTHAHGSRGSDLFLNTGFEQWNGTTMPYHWTEVDEDSGTTPNTGSIVTQVTSTLGLWAAGEGIGNTTEWVKSRRAVRIVAILQNGIIGYQDNFLVGIRQDSVIDVDADDVINVRFAYGPDNLGVSFNPEEPQRRAAMSLWLEGDDGNAYYWVNGYSDTGEWVDSGAATFPNHTTSTANASKNQFSLSPKGEYGTINRTAAETPTIGTIRLILWNPVEFNTSTPLVGGIIYDSVVVSVTDRTSSDTIEADESESTVTTLDITSVSSTLDYDAGTYVWGTAPSERGLRNIFRSGTAVSGWKSGVYGGAEASSGNTIGELQLEQLRDPKGSAREILRLGFRNGDQTDVWPMHHITLGGNEYVMTYMKRDVQYNTYECELINTGVVVQTGSPSPLQGMEILTIGDLEVVEGSNAAPPNTEDPSKYDRNGIKPTGFVRPQPRFIPIMAQSGQVIVGDGATAREWLNIRSEDDDAAIRFETVTAGSANSVYLVGVDQSDSNSFKIAELDEFTTTPTTTTGTRLKIDADGNFLINGDTTDTAWDFEFSGKANADGTATVIIGGGAVTGGDFRSGLLQFRGHYWNGVGDDYGYAQLYYDTGSTTPADTGVFALSISPGGGNGWVWNADGTWGTGAYVFPAADGTAGQFLTTDGADTVSWTDYDPINQTLSNGLSVDDTYEGMTVAGTLGTGGANFGQLCYLTSSATWVKADADAEATAGEALLGFCVDSGAATDATVILLRGTIRDATYIGTGTAGDAQYVSTAEGGITGTRPSATGDIVRVAGYFLTTNTFLFDPSNSWVEVE